MTNSTPPSAAAPSGLPPAGWYPDGQGGQRWWDGTEWSEHRAPAFREQTAGNSLAVASLVLGLVGCAVSPVTGLPFVLGLLAVIFGGVGNSRSKALSGRGAGMSIWGIVLGCLAMGAAIARIVVAR